MILNWVGNFWEFMDTIDRYIDQSYDVVLNKLVSLHTVSISCMLKSSVRNGVQILFGSQV